MSYFAPYIDGTGIHMPTYEDRLEDLITAYRNIFGIEAELSAAVVGFTLPQPTSDKVITRTKSSAMILFIMVSSLPDLSEVSRDPMIFTILSQFFRYGYSCFSIGRKKVVDTVSGTC